MKDNSKVKQATCKVSPRVDLEGKSKENNVMSENRGIKIATGYHAFFCRGTINIAGLNPSCSCPFGSCLGKEINKDISCFH